MSDEENYIKYHQGLNASDSDDSEVDENDYQIAFDYLRPKPISSQRIQQRSLYKPPSLEDISLDQDELSAEEKTTYIRRNEDFRSPKNVQDLMLNIYFNVCKELLDTLHELHNYSTNFQDQLSYVMAVEEFANSVIILKKSVEDSPLDTLERKFILIIQNLISYFHAVLVAECLIIVKHSYQSRHMNRFIVEKSVSIIKKMGSVSEITKRIENIEFRILDDFISRLELNALPNIRLDYNQIVDYLNVLSCGNINKKSRNRNRANVLVEVMNNDYSEENCELISKTLPVSTEPNNNQGEIDDCIVTQLKVSSAMKISKLIVRERNKQNNHDSFLHLWDEWLSRNKNLLICGSYEFSLTSLLNHKHLSDAELARGLDKLSSNNTYCYQHDVENIICEIMNNPRNIYITFSFIIRLVEYSIFKGVSLFNLLQYSLETFEMKDSESTFETLLDMVRITLEFEELNKFLLMCSSSEKLIWIKQYVEPISQIIEAYFFGFVVVKMATLIKSQSRCKEYHIRFIERFKIAINEKYLLNKLMHGNYEKYVEFSEKICTTIPAPAPLPDYRNIIQQFRCINIPHEFSSNSTEDGNFKNFLFFNEDDVQILDPHTIKTFLFLQKVINDWRENPSSVINHIKMYFDLLEYVAFRKTEKSQFGNFVEKFLEKIHHAMNFHMYKVCVSQFYCFILCKFLEIFNGVTELIPKSEINIFIPKLLNLFHSVCPSNTIQEKLQFRNDKLYLKYCQSLSIKSVIIKNSSSDIMKEFLGVFENYSNVLIDAGEFSFSFDSDDDMYEQVVTKILSNEHNDDETATTPPQHWLDHNLNFTSLFPGRVICQLSENPRSKEISQNSVVKHIDYSVLKVLNYFNILKYSYSNFETKNSLASFRTIKDAFQVCSAIDEFESLLVNVLLTRWIRMNTNSRYILKISKLRAQVYFLFQVHNFNDAMKCVKNRDISEKMAMEFMRKHKIMNIAKYILPLPQNISNLRNLKQYLELGYNKRTLVDHIVLNPQVRANFINLETDKVLLLIELQKMIFNWEVNETRFSFVVENIKTYLELLYKLEKNQQKISEFGCFIHRFLEKIDSFSSCHIIRIFVSQFYAFIFFMVESILNRIPEVLVEDEIDYFYSQIIDLTLSVCPVESFVDKLKYRNDELFSKYCRDFFDIEGVSIETSSQEILRNIFSILTT